MTKEDNEKMTNKDLVQQFLSSDVEERLTFPEAARVAGACLPTVNNWSSIGVRGKKLASIALGGGEKRCGRRMVLRSWLTAFLAATQPENESSPGEPSALS